MNDQQPEAGGAQLDLSGLLIREMADRHHQPAEDWLLSGQLVGVHCRQCGQSWPCETRQRLRRDFS